MYIKYTFVHFAILLIHQILGTIPLPVTSPFAVEALSLRLTLQKKDTSVTFWAERIFFLSYI